MDDILKVEEKRINSFEDYTQLEERHTVFLIDRFKFMNLYPCNANELKSLGYKDSNNNTFTSLIPHGIGTGSVLATNLANTNASIASSLHGSSTKDLTSSTLISSLANDDSNLLNQQTAEANFKSINPFNKTSRFVRPRLPCPDVSKMYPFKPNRNAFSGLQPVPGGGLFPFPSIFADMIKRLPPPSSMIEVLIYFVLFLY